MVVYRADPPRASGKHMLIFRAGLSLECDFFAPIFSPFAPVSIPSFDSLVLCLRGANGAGVSLPVFEFFSDHAGSD